MDECEWARHRSGTWWREYRGHLLRLIQDRGSGQWGCLIGRLGEGHSRADVKGRTWEDAAAAAVAWVDEQLSR